MRYSKYFTCQIYDKLFMSAHKWLSDIWLNKNIFKKKKKQFLGHKHEFSLMCILAISSLQTNHLFLCGASSGCYAKLLRGANFT